MNDAIIDILRILGHGTFVDTATSNKMAIEVQPNTVLSQKTVAEICQRFKSVSKEVVRCSVDMQHNMIYLRRGSCAVTDGKAAYSPRIRLLEPSTESERTLADAAKTLCTIDYDDLVPTFAFDSSSDYCILNIRGLLHISHDALMACLGDKYSTLRVQYDFPRGCLQLCAPYSSKRKR